MALMFDNTGSGNLTLKSPVSGAYTLEFPITAGSSGQFLKTDGVGLLSWDTPPVTSPSGNDTEIQFNSSGAFGSSSTLTYNTSTQTLASINLSLSGNVNLAGTAQRITGDFSNVSTFDRVLFQTSTTNGNTDVGIIANGTGTVSSVSVYGSSDPTNSSVGRLVANGSTDVKLVADKIGTGNYTSLSFHTNNTEQVRINTSGQLLVGNGTTVNPSIGFKDETNTGIYRPGAGSMVIQVGGAETIRVDSARNTVLGSSNLTTSSTDGFAYLPTTPGTPTGTPSSFPGHSPITFDTTNNKLYVYDSGWIDINSALATALNDLTDVNITSPTAGQILKYNGTNWYNGTESGIGSVSWGDIGGTLSNQTDLQNALNAKLDASTASSTYVELAGDTMTGTLNLPSNGLVVGTSQLIVSGGNVGVNKAVPASTLDVDGTVSHTGLAPTDGTNIDQVKQITKNLTLTTDWQDTGIKFTDLATGTYIVQLYANDIGSGGSNNNEYYSGTMSWYAGTTDSSLPLPTDEIVLHRAGGSGEGGLYLRTYRTAAADPDNLKLQIYANSANISAANYVFKFRRII